MRKLLLQPGKIHPGGRLNLAKTIHSGTYKKVISNWPDIAIGAEDIGESKLVTASDQFLKAG